MKKVCVITGGGSGMGLATAKLVCEEGYYTILVGRTASKLEKAVNDLRSAGGEAEAFSCDVSDRESCFALAKHAAECGEVKAVLHIAGLSPHMGDAEKILRGNALGTVNINDAFYEVMAPGGCVIDTSRICVCSGAWRVRNRLLLTLDTVCMKTPRRPTDDRPSSMGI